jgi:hypothetical protein
MDPCTLKNLVSASKEAVGSRKTAAAVDGFQANVQREMTQRKACYVHNIVIEAALS